MDLRHRPAPHRPAVIGMVHLRPLPGSAGWRPGAMAALVAAARADAEALLEGGCDALLVENMHDAPYLRGAVPPETVAAMTLATAEVTRLGAPTGVQVLAAANREALAIALATGASFIRAEAFAYAHVADEGWLDASAGPLLRVRAALGADIQVWADVRKKHAAHAVTADLSLTDLAHGTAFMGADALIVTGLATGHAADPDDIRRAQVGLPVVVGSGITAANAAAFAHADALIVGTSLKFENDWRRAVDPARVRALVSAVADPVHGAEPPRRV